MIAPDATAHTADSETTLLHTVNQVRARHGVDPLRVDPTLDRAADAQTRLILRTGRLAHGDLRGRLTRYGARGPTVGENLAWGVGRYAAARVIVRAWLESPGHRANLLRPGFRRIGIGRRVGPFAGYADAAVVTANFAGK